MVLTCALYLLPGIHRTSAVPDNKASAAGMKKIIDGERPPRPLKGKKPGLSDDLWEAVRSSLVHEVEESPAVILTF